VTQAEFLVVLIVKGEAEVLVEGTDEFGGES
jgi:hypothetical protein